MLEPVSTRVPSAATPSIDRVIFSPMYVSSSKIGSEARKIAVVPVAVFASISLPLNASVPSSFVAVNGRRASSIVRSHSGRRFIPVKFACSETSVQAAVDQAKANLKNAELQLNRQKALLEKGFIAASNVDQAQATYDVARATLASAQERSNTIAPEQDADMKTQRARVRQAGSRAWR